VLFADPGQHRGRLLMTFGIGAGVAVADVNICKQRKRLGGGKLLGMQEEASRQHLYGRDVASASYRVGKH
jgi:hypothetical protein